MQLFNHGGAPHQRPIYEQTNVFVRAARQHVEIQILGLANPAALRADRLNARVGRQIKPAWAFYLPVAARLKWSGAIDHG